jgi:glyoxylase-like metal-dependent hydrolase (beta-lactamase superfamily II)
MTGQSRPMLNQLTPYVHWFPPDSTTDRPIIGVVHGEQASLVVDAGNSPAHARLILEEVARLNLPPLKYLALTHWHWDHVFGVATFNLPTFAHLETRRRLVQMANWDWRDAALDQRVEWGIEIAFCRDNIKRELPDRRQLVIRPPDVTFNDGLEVDLGGVTCQIVHVGGDHSPDSSVIYVPEERVLFTGDCLCEDFYSGPLSYTTARLFPLIDTLLSFNADYTLEAHNPQPTSRQAMAADLARLKTIGRVVDLIGPDRQAVLTRLATQLDRPLDEDIHQIVDSFLAGLKKQALGLLQARMVN